MTHNLNQQSAAMAEKRLKAAIEGGDIVAAVLSTPAGNPLAWEVKFDEMVPNDVAKMATEVTRLGSLLATREHGSLNDRIVCDVMGSPVIIVAVKRLLLTFVGDMQANLGTVAGIAEQTAADFRKGPMIEALLEANSVIGHLEVDVSGEQKPQSERFEFDADGFTQKVLADLETQRSRPAS